MRHRVNSPSVIQENVEGEVIIIHLPSGCYFSLDGIAADVWDGIVQGIDDARILEAISEAWEGEPQRMAEDVRQFIDELTAEELIVAAGGANEAAPTGSGERAPGEKRVFSPPILHKYRDMQELLLIDPIHEVEETGWPEAKQEPRE
jgi:hypothetical protein